MKILNDDDFGAYLRGKLPEDQFFSRTVKRSGEIVSSSGDFYNRKLSESIAAVVKRNRVLCRLATRETVDAMKNIKPFLITEPQGGWREEGDLFQISDLVLGGYEANLRCYSLIIKVSEETLADEIYGLERWLTERFASLLGDDLEFEFINGSGSDRPKGFIHDAITEPAAGPSISYADIENLFLKLDDRFLPNAAWLCSRDAFIALAGLSDANGNPILTLRSEVDDESPDSFLLGKPLYITLLPNEKPVVFGDFAQYHIFEKPLVVSRLSEKYAINGMVGFRLTLYVDGKLIMPDSVVCLNF